MSAVTAQADEGGIDRFYFIGGVDDHDRVGRGTDDPLGQLEVFLRPRQRVLVLLDHLFQHVDEAELDALQDVGERQQADQCAVAAADTEVPDAPLFHETAGLTQRCRGG